MTPKKLTLLLFLAISTVLPNLSKACHLAAADMYIEYAGKPVDICNPVPDYTYRITMVTYSYCNCGLTTGANETVFYESKNGATGALNVVLPSNGIDTVDQLCPDFSKINQCRVPANAGYPGFYRLTYTGLVTLPSGQSDWVFSWSSTARNPSWNLAGTGRLYIEAGMDVLGKFYNNTPRFLGNPLPYICNGQKYTYLNLPFDPDPWDSGRNNVTTTVPLTGPGATVTYVSPYFPGYPIDNYSLVSSTGTATFNPINVGQYTLSFRADDAFSYITRDVQIAVLDCSAPPPQMDTVAKNISMGTLIGIPRKEDTDWVDSVVFVCPGSELSFDLNGWNDSLHHNIYMRADLTRFAGATFVPSGNGNDRVTSTFTWTPTVADYGQHMLVVTTVDSSCFPYLPIVLETNAVIQIRVVPGIDAGPDLTICELNPQPVQLYVKGTEHLRLKWSVIGGGPVVGLNKIDIHNPIINYPFVQGGDTIFYPKNTGYIISTVDLVGTCRASDTVFVDLDTGNTVRITPKNPNNEEDALVICRPSYLQLETLIKGRRPLNNVPCGTGSPTTCSTPDMVDIFGSPLYGQAFYDTFGIESPVMYTHLQSAKKEYLITKEELWQWGLRSATLRGLSFEMTGFNGASHNYNNFSISLKCTDAKELNRNNGFTNFDMTVVFEGDISLSDGWQDFKFQIPYNWDTTKNIIIQICYSNSPPMACGPTTPIPVMKFASTTFTSGLTLHPTSPAAVSVCAAGKNSNIVDMKLRPVFRFQYCEADPLPFDIVWKEGQFLSDSTIAQPLAYVSGSERYIVQTIGRSTCMMRDTLDVYVPEHDFSINPIDTAFCLGDKAPFTVSGGTYFKWYEYDAAIDSFMAPISVTEPFKGFTFIAPQKTTDYKIVVSDSVWCYDTLSAKIEILPLPDVRILNNDDTTIKYGQSFQLLATGARLYNWDNVSSLNNPNISYPIARPKDDTRYIVGGIANNGCRAFDTLHVIVDKRDNLFVPSAFSPNGDGKNDLFRVTNLSFQRILEFRVFNRWGQEVFSTNDSRTGWDGNWEGKPQGIGTYSYLIRVAYPDGFVETYKGETTLIR